MRLVDLEALSELNLADPLVFDRALDHVARLEQQQKNEQVN